MDELEARGATADAAPAPTKKPRAPKKRSRIMMPRHKPAVLTPLEIAAFAKFRSTGDISAATAELAPGEHRLRGAYFIDAKVGKAEPTTEPTPVRVINKATLALLLHRMGVRGDMAKAMLKDAFALVHAMTEEDETKLLESTPEVAAAVEEFTASLKLARKPKQGSTNVFATFWRKKA